ncbi:MAG TPA: helix-turn-helix transcriptional regulator [Puia sp.]
MIKNEKQFQVSSRKLKEFKEVLKTLDEREDINPALKEMQIGAIVAQTEILEDEIKEYSLLKNKRIANVSADSLLDLPQLLIKGRIAKGWSHAELAEKLNIKEQQIQRYEATDYETASLARIVAVAEALGLHFNPIKAYFEGISFGVPEGLSSERIFQIQAKMSERRTLLPI